MFFCRKLAPGCILGVGTGLGGGIREGDSLKSKDFSIISCKVNISSFCFAYIASTADGTANVTVLAINSLTERSMEL